MTTTFTLHCSFTATTCFRPSLPVCRFQPVTAARMHDPGVVSATPAWRSRAQQCPSADQPDPAGDGVGALARALGVEGHHLVIARRQLGLAQTQLDLAA